MFFEFDVVLEKLNIMEVIMVIFLINCGICIVVRCSNNSW